MSGPETEVARQKAGRLYADELEWLARTVAFEVAAWKEWLAFVERGERTSPAAQAAYSRWCTAVELRRQEAIAHAAATEEVLLHG